MADDGAESKGPKFWRVCEGYGSRVVREGCRLASPECAEKLAPGALVEEMALEGDRLHYWLQSGSGPTNGWVTVKVRGQDLLVPSFSAGLDGPRPEVWILTMGTRGDLQPFVVLGLALKEAGFTVRLFGPPELRSFSTVADGALDYMEICSGWGGHTLLEAAEGQGEGASAEEAKPPEEASEPQPAEPPQAELPEELPNLALGQPARASSSKSAERSPAFAVDGKPDTRWTSIYEDGQWLEVDLGKVCSLVRVEVRWEAAYAASYLLEGSLDGESWTTLASESGHEGWVTTSLSKGASARWVRVLGQTRGLPNYGFSIFEVCVRGAPSSEGKAPAAAASEPDAEREPSGGEAAAAPAAAGAQVESDAPAEQQEEQQQQPELVDESMRAGQQAQNRFVEFLGAVGVDTNNPGDVEHMAWLWREMPRAVLAIQSELKLGKPDLLLYNHLMVPAGLFAWRSFGVRSVFVNLGLEFYFAPQAQDVFNYRTLSSFDHHVLRSLVGVTTVASMRPKDFNELYTSPDRILGTTRLLRSVMPLKEKEKDLADSWNFTGFWILEEQRQMEDPAAFGGPELLQRLQRFVDAGRPPVYMGWGSMPVGPRVLAIAVSALRKLQLRAVVVRGWGHLSREFLEPGIWEMGLEKEEAELQAYTDKNLLFIDRAPHEWLFPRCACTVHHGGAGTTAAALRAGVPTIIVPLGYDQTYHGDWVESLGVGVKCGTVMEIQEPEFHEALRRATSEPSLQECCRKVAASLREEPGVAGAVSQIRRIIREDVRSGKARLRWQAEDAEKRIQEEKTAKQRERILKTAEERRKAAELG